LAGSQAEVHSSIKAKEIPQIYVGCTRYLVGFTENIGIEHAKHQKYLSKRYLPNKIGNNYQMWGCSGIYI
jgi:hypothetical protein